MSKRIGNIFIIKAELDQKCELCGVLAECRPYGPNGKQVCYDCAQKDKVGTEERMKKIMFGVNEPKT